MIKEISQCGRQNPRQKCIFVFILLSVFMTSCRSNKFLIDSNEVESLHFWYISPNASTFVAITDCVDIVYEDDRRDTIIADRDVIKRYVDIVNSLKPIDPNSSYDLRMSSLIRMKQINGKRKPDVKVCVGGPRALVNGVLMKERRGRMTKFFYEVLVDPLTPYDWLPNGIKEYLKDHPEEIDNILSN